MTTCADTTLSLGVYLLGALDPAERGAVDAHLADCASCRAELGELAALPSMLSQLSIDDVTIEPVDVPADLFERVASQARAEDARKASARQVARHRRLFAAAAVIVLIMVVTVGSLVAVRHHSPGHYSTTAGSVHMSVKLASQATGTGYAVTVSGLPVDEHCQLIAVGKDGTREVAGRWNATYQGTATQIGSTSIPQSDLAELVLLGTNGAPLATVNV
jgi:predicted anti-sigma-YlaC factor YlaD